MPGIGIGVGIGMKKAGNPYPVSDLDVIVFTETYEEEGTTYYKTSIGVGLDVIGQDTDGEDIINFAPLNDLRFDKGCHTGNGYVDGEGDPLPAYYDFPYNDIYYDDTTEATRYHWKIKDFNYKNILAQSLLLDNQFCLRAIATTETSNEIETAYQVNIYATSQTGTDLTKLKTWMRIAPAFEGDELIRNGDFSIDSNSDGLADEWIKKNDGVYSIVNGFQRYYTEGGDSYPGIRQNVVLPIGTFNIKFNYKTNAVINALFGSSLNVLIDLISDGLVHDYDVSIETSEEFTYFQFVIMNASTTSGSYFEVDNVSIKLYYENYYKP